MPNKTVFISGATSGIGFAAAQQLDALGWRVFAAGLPDGDFTALTQEASQNLTALPLDITDAQAVSEAAAQIIQETDDSGLHGLVNSAGIQIVSPLEALPIERLQQQLEVNLYGHLRMTQALLPALRKARGRIVNVSSLMGRVAMPLLGAYSISKHALEALTDGLRLELAPWGIHVASVQPGAVATPMTAGMQQMLAEAEAELPEQAQADYADLFQAMSGALAQQNANAVPVEKVADAILHALSSDNPKIRYAVGAAAAGLLAMRTYAPDAIGDAILKRALGLRNP